jgi:hypothetical protein
MHRTHLEAWLFDVGLELKRKYLPDSRNSVDLSGGVVRTIRETAAPRRAN